MRESPRAVENRERNRHKNRQMEGGRERQKFHPSVKPGSGRNLAGNVGDRRLGSPALWALSHHTLVLGLGEEAGGGCREERGVEVRDGVGQGGPGRAALAGLRTSVAMASAQLHNAFHLPLQRSRAGDRSAARSMSEFLKQGRKAQLDSPHFGRPQRTKSPLANWRNSRGFIPPPSW